MAKGQVNLAISTGGNAPVTPACLYPRLGVDCHCMLLGASALCALAAQRDRSRNLGSSRMVCPRWARKLPQSTGSLNRLLWQDLGLERPMKKSRFTESQIVAILKEGEAGVAIARITRKYGIDAATYYQAVGSPDPPIPPRCQSLSRDSNLRPRLTFSQSACKKLSSVGTSPPRSLTPVRLSVTPKGSL